jgi:hypothetical protein
MSWKAIDRYSKDYIELQTKDNVKFYKTPDAILKQQLEIFDEGREEEGGENPLFKEIVESQLAFAKRATQWEQDTVVSRQDGVRSLLGPNAKKRSERSTELAEAPFGSFRMVLCFCSTCHGAASMTVEKFLHTIDGISTWVGKAAPG